MGVLESGGYRLVRGPANYVVGSSPSVATALDLASLLHGGALANNRWPRIAAVRGMRTKGRSNYRGIPLPDTLWDIDYDSSSRSQCFRRGTNPQFFRRFDDTQATITMVLMDGAKVVEQSSVAALRDQPLLKWPFQEKPKPGLVVKIFDTSPHEEGPRQVELRQVSSARESLPDLASDLLNAGCAYQLTLLTESFGTDSGDTHP